MPWVKTNLPGNSRVLVLEDNISVEYLNYLVMDKDDNVLNDLFSTAEKVKGSGKIPEPVGTLYPETKWGPDKDHPIDFDDIEYSYEREFFEGNEHLKEVYPKVTKGMLVNFSVNGALFDPVTQTPSDMTMNYKALASVMSKKDFSYEKMAEKLSEFDIDDRDLTVLTERAYLNSEALQMRACRSLGYESVEQMPRDIRNTYDGIIERAQNSNEYLKIIQDAWGTGSFYANSEQLVTVYEESIASGEVDDDVADVIEKGIKDVREMYVDGKMDSKDGIAYVNVNEVKNIGVNVAAHEMAHYVYNKEQVNPGVHEINNEYKGEGNQFGRKNSPLDEIDKDKVKYNLTYLLNAFGGNANVANMVYKPKTEEEKELAKGERDHDNVGFERAADIHGVRMLMFKEGIFNPFDGSDVTPEQVGKFMETHPNSRIFRYWNEKQSRFFLNNIAFNDSLRETVGKNILAAIDENDKEINAMRGNSFGKGRDAPSMAAANMVASSFQQIYDENIGRGQEKARGLSV